MSVKFALRLKKTASSDFVQPPESYDDPFQSKDSWADLLLIHGLTGTPNEMRFLSIYLSKRGYSCVRPRLANHGAPMEILKNTTWRECYESVRREFLKIRARRSGKPIIASGLSMGALLALVLAYEFPDDLAGVSCLAPTLFYDGWNMPWQRHLLPLAQATPLKHFFYFKEEPPYGIKNEQVRERVHQYYQNAKLDDLKQVARFGYPYFSVTLLCELNALIKFLIPKLPAIRLPVQLVQAKHDDMTSTRNSQFIHDQISSKTKEIVLLEDSYHVVAADQERETVAERMDEFFRKTLDQSCVPAWGLEYA
jgi:carboxylesterase